MFSLSDSETDGWIFMFVVHSGAPFVLTVVAGIKVKASQGTVIYFLDIDLNSDMNGMKLAQQIRLFAPRGFIVFITAHSGLSALPTGKPA